MKWPIVRVGGTKKIMLVTRLEANWRGIWGPGKLDMDIVTLNPARSKMAVPNTGGKYPISFIINDETSGSGELYDFAVIFLVCSNLCIGSELLIIGKYTTPKLLLNSIGPFLVRSNPRKLTHKTVCMSFCLLLPLLEAYAYSADETQENKISLIEVLVFFYWLLSINSSRSLWVTIEH